MKYLAKLFIIALLKIIIIIIKADPQVITIKDWTGSCFAPYLVNYIIPNPVDGGKGLRMLENLRIFVECLKPDKMFFGRFQS